MGVAVTMAALLVVVSGGLTTDMSRQVSERSTHNGDATVLLTRLKDMQGAVLCLNEWKLLRGGGKGRSKVRHLGRSKEGVRAKINKHTFPHLKRGSDHTTVQMVLKEKNGTMQDNEMRDETDPEMEERKYYAKPISTYEDPSFESVSSADAKEQHRAIFRYGKASAEEMPTPGIVPLTYSGSQRFGVIQVSQTYMGKPLKIYRRERDPRDGIIWGWGANYDGQLGIANGCKIDRWTPTQQVFIPDGGVQAIAAGEAHSLFLMDDGSGIACGVNSCGQLGDGTLETRREAVRIADFDGAAVSLAAGSMHSMALLEDGTVMSWGSNSSAQLGPALNLQDCSMSAEKDVEDILKSTGNENLPPERREILLKFLMEETNYTELNERVKSANITIPLRQRRAAWRKAAAFNAVTRPIMISQQFFNDHPVVAIAAGSTFSLAATTEGSIFQWGNLSWEERIVRQPERVKGVAGAVKSLAVGGRHCLAVMEDGSLFAWGCNEAGQLGDGTRTLRQEAVRVLASGVRLVAAGESFTVSLMEDSSVLVWGSNGLNSTTEPTRVEGIPARPVAVTAGRSGNVLVLTDDGHLITWGDNARGQCGVGKGTRKGPNFVGNPVMIKKIPQEIVAISSGHQHSLAITRRVE